MQVHRSASLCFTVSVLFVVAIILYLLLDGQWNQRREQNNKSPHSLKLQRHFTTLSSQSHMRNSYDIHKHTALIPNKDVYVLSNSYGGQMTRAIKNMMIHQCVCGLINDRTFIVEPFSSESNLYQPHNAAYKDKLGNSARFSDYYDLNFYNTKSVEAGASTLIKWEDFLERAPREIVLVEVPPQCKLLKSKAENFTCLPQLSQRLKDFNFSMTKTICIDCNQTITTAGLWNSINIEDQSSFTVVFNYWRNFLHTSLFLDVPMHCKVFEQPEVYASMLRPSEGILKHTEYYRHSIIKSDRVIAIMLRIERFLGLQRVGKSNESINSCLKQSLLAHDNLRREMENSEVFLTADIGRFGSGVMQDSTSPFRQKLHSITQLVSDMINKLYGGRFTLQTWENSFIEASEGITERGYIAMLQRSIATSSDCLILMGGGSFQEVAARQYLEKHPDSQSQCLHTVCTHENFLYH